MKLSLTKGFPQLSFVFKNLSIFLFLWVSIGSVSAQKKYPTSQVTGTTLGCVLCTVVNPTNSISANLTDFATLNIPVGILGASVYQTFVWPALNEATDSLVIVLGDSGPPEIFASLIIKALDNNTTVFTKIVSQLDFDVDENNHTIKLRLKPGVSFNRVQITLTGITNMLNNADIYYVYAEKDDTPPNAPTALLMAVGSDSGFSNSDGITNVDMPVITGKAEANSTVVLFDSDGHTVLGTATANGSGKWSITTIPLAEGTHQLRAKATDAAGNVSAESSILDITIDKTPPTGIIAFANSGDRKNNIRWDLDPDIATYELMTGASVGAINTVLTTVSAADATTTYIHTGLSNSTMYFYAMRVTDAAGNVTVGMASHATPLAGQTITFNLPVQAEYGSSFTVTATSTSNLPVTLTSSNTAFATVSGNTVTIVGVDHLHSVSITATQAGSASYSTADPVVHTLQILPKPITITAQVNSKEYGSPDPVFNASISPSLINNDQIIGGAIFRAPGDDAGTYVINVSNIQLDPNKYAVTYVPADFTINKKPITITPKFAYSKTYGEIDPVLGYNFSPLVSPDVITGELKRVDGENAGTYNFDLGTINAGTNYNLILSPLHQFTINKSVITVTPITASIQYGDTEPVISYNHTPALKTGDAFTGALGRMAGTIPNSYLINAGDLALSSNYILSFSPTPVNFVVLKKNIDITPTAGQGKVYGDVDGSINYVANPTLINGDTFSGALGRATGSTVANYLIGMGTLAASNPQNYNLQLANENYAIRKASVTVTAAAASKSFEAMDPASFSYTASTALLAGNVFSGRLERQVGEAVGNYDIEKGSLAITSGNYDINYVGAKFSIAKQQLMITPKANLEKVYSENDPITFDYDVSPNLPGLTFTGSLSRTPGEDVGLYDFNLGTLSGGSTYELTLNSLSKFNITKKTINVVPDAVNQIYGDPIVAPTYTYSPELKNGDVFNGGIVVSTASSVGEYVFGVGTLQLSSNYDLVFTPGSIRYVIGKKPITITAVPATKTYGAADPIFDYTSTPALISGDTFTGVLDRTSGENVGSYALSLGSLKVNNNYALSLTLGALTIGKAVLTATVDNQSKVYGAGLPVLTASYAGFVNGDTQASLTTPASLFTTATAASSVADSPYDITASGAINPNYTINYVTGVLTVTKAALTITAVNKDKFAGTANPALTASYSGFANGESTEVVTTAPNITTTAVTNSPIGDYPITASGAVAANYSIGYVNGVLTVKAGAPTSINLAAVTLFENRAIGANAGTLSSTSDDPATTFTYLLVAGTGDTDNALFAISGNAINTATVLDYETKSTYSIRVRSTTQYGFSLDKVIAIDVSEVNEVPTLAAIGSQTICYTRNAQNVELSGISAGSETNQTPILSVSSTNEDLFDRLGVSGTGSTGTLVYQAKTGATGTAMVTVTVKDGGGIANGGVDTYSRSFVITVNALPVLSINSDKGTQISKGETVFLNATGAATYAWAVDNSIVNGASSATLEVRPRQTTTYTVTGTNASGCSETQSFTITVLDDLAKIKANNILTPNGDGFNDKWVVDNIDFYPNNEVKVFDKAGRFVFAKKGYDNSWDGTYNGTALAEGTYYYVIDFGTGRQVFKGYITIIREN